MNKKSLLSVVIASAVAAPAMAEETVAEFLDRFHANPAEVMNETPHKDVVNSAPVPMHELLSVNANGEYELTEEYLTFRDRIRADIMSSSVPMASGLNTGRLPMARSAINEYSDSAYRLVDNSRTMLKNVHQMDQQSLQAARLQEQPWSDTYWPLYNGSLGDRYADPEKWSENPNNWQEYYDFANIFKPVSQYLASGQTDLLSPSEKYDLLVSDQSYTLTKKMWDSGRGYYENNGSVETWMGLCHGWAPAAYALPRPKQSVTVTSASGKKVKFFPSDIKALGTLLWSNASPQVRFVGRRCNTKNPDTDANGRIIDEGCFDTNPGTWHQAVVNQIGVSKRSFIIDATYDYQVWNQPVLSYKYNYYNPETGTTSNKAAASIIPIDQYSRDKFKKYRAPNATHVVGVRMNIEYMVETQPNHRVLDKPEYDYINRVTYTYDLELDAQGNIIGGEWYQNKHPDFLWTPAPGAEAVSYYNPNGTWNTQQPLPAAWTQKAEAASSYSQPLTAVVSALFKASSGEVTEPEPTPQYPAWKKSKYYKQGDRVMHAGDAYEALWYNRGQEPGRSWFWRKLED